MTVPQIVAAPPVQFEDMRVERRKDRLDARYVLWALSGLARVRACGRFVTDKEHGVTVKVTANPDGTRVAGLGGVQSCGSVWSCPCCAEQIQAQRQAEVGAALAVARRKGWEVLFLTLTMRHGRDHRLPRLWEHLSHAWRKTTSGAGRKWADDKEVFGVQGYLRLVEVTHGENGWHVHVHCLLFVDPAAASFLFRHPRSGQLTDVAVAGLGGRMFDRWQSALDVKGIRPSTRRGVDIRRVRSDEAISEYFAKNMYDRKGESSTAHDVTGAHAKTAKNGNRTPFGILRSLVSMETGEVSAEYDRDLALWQTFEKASKGRRQLLWSKGLRGRLLEEDEQTDEEIVAEDHGGEVLEWLSPAEFTFIAKRRWLSPLLLAAERGHFELAAWLNANVKPHRPDL